MQSFHNFNTFILTRFALKDFKLGLKFQLLKGVKKGLILKRFGPCLRICATVAYFDKFTLDSLNMWQNGLF